MRHGLELADAEHYGLLKLRAALRGDYLDTAATLSQGLRAFAARMDEADAERGCDFAEEVREKARVGQAGADARDLRFAAEGTLASDWKERGGRSLGDS